MNKLPVGAKVKFEAEKGAYTVRACSKRYAICTKPFNPKRTVIYTIVDFERDVRGTNNLIFNVYDYGVQADIDQCLRDLEDPQNVVEVSHRNCVELDIETVIERAAPIHTEYVHAGTPEAFDAVQSEEEFCEMLQEAVARAKVRGGMDIVELQGHEKVNR